MSSSDSYIIEILNNSIIYIHRYIVPVIYVLGNIGNLLNALVFAKKSWRKNVCVFYFNSLLFFNTCYINCSILSSIFTLGFNINLQNSNVILCKIYLYVEYLFATFLPTILILASIDRLLISSQNVDTRLYSSKRLAYFSVSISTVFWVVFYFHVLIKVSIQQLGPSTFICYYDLSPSYLSFVSYSSLTFVCGFCLIMIVLCLLAFKNVRRIRTVPRQQRQLRTMTKKDFQLLRCLYVQDVVFIVFSLGATISTVYQVVTVNQVQTSLQQAIVNFTTNFCIFLNYIPYCVSFYIFLAVSKAFRNEMKRMVYKICRKDLTPIHEEENNKPELNVVVVSNIVS
jgi:hypothetical protein